MPYTKKTSSPNDVLIHYKLKDCAPRLLGKTIQAVVLKGSRAEPKSQLMLVFTDGTVYEIYGEFFGGARLDDGGLDFARRYLEKRSLDVFEAVDRRVNHDRRRRFLDEVN